MITKMTGTLVRVCDDDIRVAVGPFEYQVLVPESVRRQLQLRTGQDITLHVTEYLEGNSGGSRFVPRKIGFTTTAELEFFELFCTVDKIGVKKALKALCRNVRDIADAIARQDAKWLTTLPGIGAATAEQIITTLKRKVGPFAVASGDVVDALPGTAVAVEPPPKEKKPRKSAASAEPTPEPTGLPSGQVIEDVYLALMALGLTPIEAREKLDKLLQSGKRFADVSEAMTLLFGKA